MRALRCGVAACSAKYSKMVKVGTAKICFLFHEAHGLVAELIGVIDRDNAGLRRIECSGLSGGVNRDMFAEARRFFDRGFELRLRCTGKECESLSVSDRVGAGLIDLDEVRAFLELLAHDGHEFVGAVGVVGVGEYVLLRGCSRWRLRVRRGC